MSLGGISNLDYTVLLCSKMAATRAFYRDIMKFLPGVPFAHNKSAMAAQRRVKNLVPSPVQIERYSIVSLG